MLDITLSVNLTLKGPILTQSTATGSFGVDSPVARNAAGKCYLPGTLVKGRLRQAWEELGSISGTGFNINVQSWLGEKTANPDNKTAPIIPSRGRLHFQDFIDNSDRKHEVSFRINLDEDRGAVRKGAYQVIEVPYAPGEAVTFTGIVQYFAANSSEASEIKRWVEIGLRWITSLGAERTVGFGQLLGVEILEDRQILTTTNTVAAKNGAPFIDFVLKPNSPFCIARRQINDNLFESEIVIPGGVLKGCIATTWYNCLGSKGVNQITEDLDETRPELCRHFAKLRFTHAFPGDKTQQIRPVVAPLSLVKVKKDEIDQVYDVALCDGPVLLGNPPSSPSFAIDWKHHDDVQADFGWPDLDYELRVRTAIDRSLRRAKDEQLFSYEMVVPRNDVTWYGQIDLSQVPTIDHSKVEAQLREILSQGLYSLGKTKSQADLTFYSQGTIQSKQVSTTVPQNGLWIVTLQTPALLCNPIHLNEASGHEELFVAYNEVWNQISGHSLQLVRFFAQQSLAGGFYLHRRFQPGKAYNPYLLTEAGSVFVLRAQENQTSKAQQCINDWYASGLPLPEWAVLHYTRENHPGDHWTNCPYLSTNGYGEIAVNLQVHWSKHPKKGEFYVI